MRQSINSKTTKETTHNCETFQTLKTQPDSKVTIKADRTLVFYPVHQKKTENDEERPDLSIIYSDSEGNSSSSSSGGSDVEKYADQLKFDKMI